MVTFIDLFAGIGGFRKAFEAAGASCVFTSEWNLFSRKTYEANFAITHPIVGDITQIAAEQIPPHELLLGGFPCQPFSIAGISKKNSLGKNHGFLCEAQGTLFFDIARILAHHRPAAFVLENVKNLVSHNKGHTFKTIMHVLEQDLGYQVQWRIFDANAFVPQHRERIFIVGFREKTAFRLDQVPIPDKSRWPVLSHILHTSDESPEPPYTQGSPFKVQDKYTLSDKLWTYLQAYAQKHQAKGNGFGFGLKTPDCTARTLSARYYKDGSEILIAQEHANPRKLTPRECARLMGFDLPGESHFHIPVSDTQAYRQFGNAVVVPVVQAIAMQLIPHIAIKTPVSLTEYA